MTKKKLASIVLFVVLALALVFSVALAAKIWTVESSEGTRVVRITNEDAGDFKVEGYDSAAYFDGVAQWYKDCNATIERVYVKTKASGVVQVICISAYPTPAPTQSP
jgi:hypothetical protein